MNLTLGWSIALTILQVFYEHTLAQVPQEHIKERNIDGMMAATMLFNLTKDHLKIKIRSV